MNVVENLLPTKLALSGEVFTGHYDCDGIRLSNSIADFRCLEQLVLEGHVRFWLQADASTEDVGQGCALLSQGIDNRGARRCERRLS